MEKREELQQKADDKLLGRLQDEQAFAEELANDPDLAEILADTEMALEAIEAAEDQALKARLQKLEGTLAKQQKGSPLKVVRDVEEGAKVVPLRPSFIRKNWAATAAAIAIVLSAGYFLLMPSDTMDASDLFAANFEPYPNIAVALTRSSEASTPDEIAFAAYENGEYERAATLISALGEETKYAFYTAQAYLAQEDYSQAQALLVPIANTPADPLHEEAAWYLALANLGMGDTATAKSKLNTIAQLKGHAYQDEAIALLKEL